MQRLWQLKKISTNQTLNEPQLLPENWGPIFGMSGFLDKLNNLSWLSKEYEDMGWFDVGPAPEEDRPSIEETVRLQIRDKLKECDWMVAADNVEITKTKRNQWIEYRRKLRELHLDPNFPDNMSWPSKPE